MARGEGQWMRHHRRRQGIGDDREYIRRGNTMADKRTSKAGAFTDDERAAMKEHAREVKAASRRAGNHDAEDELLAKIAEMPEADRAIGEKLHRIIKAAAPSLTSRTWYGMPAYARDGDVVCFFQNAGKFKARYGTLGFSDKARLDAGAMWPTSFALKELTPETEARIAELVKKAVS